MRGEPPIEPDEQPGQDIAGHPEAQFARTVCTGMTPYGMTLDPEIIPWEFYTDLTNEEITAHWLYLQSLSVGEESSQSRLSSSSGL